MNLMPGHEQLIEALLGGDPLAGEKALKDLLAVGDAGEEAFFRRGCRPMRCSATTARFSADSRGGVTRAGPPPPCGTTCARAVSPGRSSRPPPSARAVLQPRESGPAIAGRSSS